MLIGGNPIGRAGTANRSELPAWFRDTKWGLDWAGTILGFVSGKGELKKGVQLGLQAAGVGVKAYSQSGAPGAKAVGFYGGAIVAGGKIATGSFSGLGNGLKVGSSVVGQGNSGLNYFSGGPSPHTY